MMMSDEPTSNSGAKVKLAGKHGYQTVIIGDDQPQMEFYHAEKATTITFIICAAIVACVFIVSIAVYETKKLSVPQVSESK